MSYQEKRSITNMISSVLITGIYTYIQYQRYLNGAIDDSNIFKFWAVIILVFIPITVISKIVIMIIFHIINAVVQTAKGEEIEEEVSDERDKLIEMKASRNSMFVFAIGFIIALITQLYDVSPHVFFITMIVFGFITDIVSELLTIKYYRRGV